MKAEDLFPGALVGRETKKYPDNIFTVIEVGQTMKVADRFETWFFDVRDLEPILLTPEILTEWFGFQISGGGIIEKWHTRELLGETYKRPICLEYWKGGHYDVRVFTTTFCTIQYVHELQRAWHVVTGQLLKRKDYD